ncbi:MULTISPECIES: LysR substrate-binding domain-containing protein [unclassified Beijerinckia]|uniref:LysR substrate-binding domain-containing protein n=1 Tax=unclassified Beijerinckia TaxID=2638183 RepID=UPI0008981567|nr:MULTISPECIES: LysR substrate-binding domain-containing protein [unclassified Beijerinckia]MDH7799913.1 DNA-binding transcriptional LysR family regulator [Beijerinckia sp. GAS462]SED42237.1 transcriptional regulator, LysR family [Beijerinckia sp. 28-YEA-48]
MTLQQLRLLREISRAGLNISAASGALRTSQPNVSRQIKALEAEIGIELLMRKKNRIVGFTTGGRAVLQQAERILRQIETISDIAQDARGGGEGRLIVATSHLHARYTLLDPFARLREKHPKVELLLIQADQKDLPRLVQDGEADLGISTGDAQAGRSSAEVATLKGEVIKRSAIMLRQHPLAAKKNLSLVDLTHYPFIGYNPRSVGGRMIADAVQKAGIDLRPIVQAEDSDVIRAYVEHGLGVGIVPTMCIAGKTRLHATDATHLFAATTVDVSLRRDLYLRSYITDFIQMASPKWTASAIKRALAAPVAKPRKS